MRYPDLFLISEAWNKAEHFEREAERARLLKLAAPPVSPTRHRLAQAFVQLAARLDPQLAPAAPGDGTKDLKHASTRCSATLASADAPP